MHVSTPRFSLHKTVLALGLTLMGGMFTGNSRAQDIVEDPGAIAQALQQYIAEIQQYAVDTERWVETHQQYLLQAQHYAAQVQFWEQQLIKLKRLQFDLVQMQITFRERPLDYGMDSACPGSPGGLGEMIDGVFQQLIPQLGDDIPTQQLKLCQQIVVAKNSKYNATVDVLGRLIEYQAHFQNIETQRMQVDQTSDPGALAANDNEALRFIDDLNTEMRYWQANMSAYDQYIGDLKDQQAVLAQHALKGGQSTIWSQVVDVVALKAAFSQ